MEFDMFQRLRAIILNGDVAIKAVNQIARRKTKKRVIPVGSTYKLRQYKYYWNEIRVFPSYILTGKNFLIEKSKRQMISEDIRQAIQIIAGN